ncbi:glycosyltransferase family 39 protein [Falsiroseomonas sp.]|uniref:glycosyltransferase family 39 protein n=1 Tax=Falsiroseomonas sp. TaxID=2870721 RepID=UPI0035669B15
MSGTGIFGARDGTAQATSQRQAARGWVRALGAAGLFLAVALLLRALSFTAALIDPDEGLYLLQAVTWLQGGWPYLAIWDMHPPGAPALIALVHALVPEPVIALRLTGVLAVTATACGLRALARLLGAPPAAALGAGLLYIAHTIVLGGLATNTEVLFAPFVVLAALLLLREALSAAPPRAGMVLAAGLAAGFALFIKQVTAIETSALWLTMCGAALAAGRLAPGRIPLLAAAFALGAALPSLGVAAGYWAGGEIDAWLEGNLFAPLRYADTDGYWPGLRQGLFGALPHLGWLALAALGVLAGDAGIRRAGLLLLPWLVGAALAVAAPWKFYLHYFLILMAPLSVLAVLGLTALARIAIRPPFAARAFALGVALLAAMPVVDTVMPRLAHGLGLRGTDPVRQVAALAAEALRPGEALFVANWHVTPYVLAGEPPPTRLAFPAHLAGRFAGVTGEDVDAELARVLALPPGVIVVAPAFWPLIRPEARAAIEAALARGYALFATVQDGSYEVEVWRRR